MKKARPESAATKRHLQARHPQNGNRERAEVRRETDARRHARIRSFLRGLK